MSDTLTRIRIEAKGATEREVRNQLTEAIEHITDKYPGGWHEPQPMTIQTTKRGYWGYVVILRNGVDESSEVKRAVR